jgi:hypothetical protein
VTSRKFVGVEKEIKATLVCRIGVKHLVAFPKEYAHPGQFALGEPDFAGLVEMNGSTEICDVTSTF